ncbi:hypothetical protein FKW77_008682 [Venturia effusa]|uniref:Uncharacterized protein n=1 Tax=Venturia effusa TaxID=50376 RepID=A0A517L5Z7_9PEZI|nr:hypothetical protein FKW77_008682 [Venturia effusa]
MRDAIVLATLLAFPLSFVIILTKHTNNAVRHSVEGHSPIGLAGEVNGIVPPFPSTSKTFRHDSIFWPFKDVDLANVAESKWNFIVEEWRIIRPFGGGWLKVDDWDQHILPRPVRLDVTKMIPMYSISIFHQLHCLTAIFSEYLTARQGKAPEADLSHTLHCYDYLRQTVMCHGDSTLEYVAEGRSQETLEYGYESPRVCRDFNAVLNYAWKHNAVKMRDLIELQYKVGGSK